MLFAVLESIHRGAYFRFQANTSTERLSEREGLQFVSPLHVFLIRLTQSRKSVVENLRLEDGSLFSMPICLDVSGKLIERTGLTPGVRVTLRDFRDECNLAIMTIDDVYKPDKSVLRH